MDDRGAAFLVSFSGAFVETCLTDFHFILLTIQWIVWPGSCAPISSFVVSKTASVLDMVPRHHLDPRPSFDFKLRSLVAANFDMLAMLRLTGNVQTASRGGSINRNETRGVATLGDNPTNLEARASDVRLSKTG